MSYLPTLILVFLTAPTYPLTPAFSPVLPTMQALLTIRSRKLPTEPDCPEPLIEYPQCLPLRLKGTSNPQKEVPKRINSVPARPNKPSEASKKLPKLPKGLPVRPPTAPEAPSH